MNTEAITADADPMSPIANEVNNLVIFTIPQKQQNDSGPWFIAAVAGDPDATIEANLKTSLPPLWNGKYQGHFVSVSEFLGDSFKADWLAELGITHLALLESVEHGENDPMYFAGDAVTHNGAILWFNQNKQQYYFIHCRGCAIRIIQWVLERQEGWEKSAQLPAGRA